MDIAIIGFGKMGKEIQKIAIERGHNVAIIIDKCINDNLIKDASNCDVAIEFTQPDSAINNYLECFKYKIPVVSGTTGWLDKYEVVENACKENNSAFFYASNFSIGVNIFFYLNEKLAGIMNKFNAYHPRIKEIHHTQKLDAPSGTAISIANGIIKNNDNINNWSLIEDYKNEINTIPVEAERRGNVPGTHHVNYNSEFDKLKICHEAKSRKGFAIGAVMAAEFIKDKKGIFTMNDLLNI